MPLYPPCFWKYFLSILYLCVYLPIYTYLDYFVTFCVCIYISYKYIRFNIPYIKCSTFVLYYFSPWKYVISATPLQGIKSDDINRGETGLNITKKGCREGRLNRYYQ